MCAYMYCWQRHNEFEVCVMVLAVMRVLCAAVHVRGPTWPRELCARHPDQRGGRPTDVEHDVEVPARTVAREPTTVALLPSFP